MSICIDAGKSRCHSPIYMSIQLLLALDLVSQQGCAADFGTPQKKLEIEVSGNVFIDLAPKILC